jgi:hypothetical protein
VVGEIGEAARRARWRTGYAMVLVCGERGAGGWGCDFACSLQTFVGATTDAEVLDGCGTHRRVRHDAASRLMCRGGGERAWWWRRSGEKVDNTILNLWSNNDFSRDHKSVNKIRVKANRIIRRRINRITMRIKALKFTTCINRLKQMYEYYDAY